MASDEERAREFMRTINDHNFEAAVRVLAEAFASAREAALREAWVRIDHDDPATLPNGRDVDFVVDASDGRRFVACGYYDEEKNDWVDPSNCDAAGDPNPYAPGEVTHWRQRPAPPPPPTKGTSE